MADPRLRQKLERGEFIVAPGVFDLMSTMMVQRVGFDAVLFTSVSALAAELANRGIRSNY